METAGHALIGATALHVPRDKVRIVFMRITEVINKYIRNEWMLRESFKRENRGTPSPCAITKLLRDQDTHYSSI